MEPSQTLEPLREESPRGLPATAKPLATTIPNPVTLEPVRVGIRESFHDAWTHRHLLSQLGARFLAKRVQGTKLGRFWLLFRPLMDSLGKTLLFGSVLGVTAPGGVPYYLFLMSGLLTWRLFERSLLYGMRSFSLYRKMMKSFRFPLLLVPLAGMAYPVMEIAIYVIVFFGAVVYFWATKGELYLEGFPQLLLVIPGVVLLLITIVGFLLWTSVLNAKARDTRLLLRYVLQPWLYITPVLYALPEKLHWLNIVNPMSAPVELVKSGLIGVGDVELPAVATSLGFGTALLVSGAWFFNREAAKSIETQQGLEDDDEEDI